MMNSVSMKEQFLQHFPRQLRYWARHCFINAIPSLIIALAWGQLYKFPVAITAMICAIATFILLYAVITSLPSPLAEDDHLLARSIHCGAKIRSWVAGISIPLVCIPGFALITPDLWLGMCAMSIIRWITQSRTDGISPPPDFWSIYAITMLEGIFISFLLLMIAFFAFLFIQSKQRRSIESTMESP